MVDGAKQSEAERTRPESLGTSKRILWIFLSVVCSFAVVDAMGLITHQIFVPGQRGSWGFLNWGIAVLLSTLTALGGVGLTQKPEKQASRNAKRRVDLGRLTSSSVDRGGFLSSSISTITTDQGDFRVYGDVGSLVYGELVFMRDGYVWVGVVTQNRKYRMVGG